MTKLTLEKEGDMNPDTTANPAPLGLLAFGMTTVLLNLHNSGLFPLDTMILAMGIFYGGLAQVIVGKMEWQKGNMFGMVAFSSYGLFWWTLVALIVMPKLGMGDGPGAASMVAYLCAWGVFTGVLFIGTLRLNGALMVVFASLTVLFFMLAYGDFSGNADFKLITGYEGVFCGLSAVYAGFALILNEVYGRVVLPLGPVTK